MSIVFVILLSYFPEDNNFKETNAGDHLSHVMSHMIALSIRTD